MPALAYYEDADFEIEIDEADIRRSKDVEELLAWREDAEAVCEDIKAQIQVAALAGEPNKAWVYRAGKAMGFMRRAQARIKSRLLALGWLDPYRGAEITEMQQKLAEAKAREAVAIEFLRLCQEGALGDRAVFERIERRAVELVKVREAEAARKAARAADHQKKVAA